MTAVGEGGLFREAKASFCFPKRSVVQQIKYQRHEFRVAVPSHPTEGTGASLAGTPAKEPLL